MADRFYRQTVLIASDYADVDEALYRALSNAGFAVKIANIGDDIARATYDLRPVLIFLCGDKSVIHCRAIRRAQKHLNPLIIIVASEPVNSRDDIEAQALNDSLGGKNSSGSSGADAYVPFPFSDAVLLARIKALLRRAGQSASTQLRYHDISVDLVTYKVTRNSRRVYLGPTEFRLLTYLVRNSDRVISRDELLDMVWGEHAAVQPHNVNVYVQRLRRSLNAPDERDLIHTAKGFGYALMSSY